MVRNDTVPYFWHQMQRRDLAGPQLKFDLDSEFEELGREKAWTDESYNAKTLAKYPDLRMVVMRLKAGATVKEHQAPGRVALHVLKGHIQVNADGRTIDLSGGQLLTLDGRVRHDLTALEEAEVLLTVLVPLPAA